MTDLIPDDRVPEIAKAIAESHYPDVHAPDTFIQDAKAFVAAFNECVELASEGAPFVAAVPGGAVPGPVTLPGAVVGMRVASVTAVVGPALSMPGVPHDFSAYFESVISRKDEILQKASSPNLSASKLQFTLRPPRVLRDQATGAPSLPGTRVLFFRAVPPWVRVGLFVRDMKTAAAITPHATVVAISPTTVTLSDDIVAPGVGLGDAIHFSLLDEAPASAGPAGASGDKAALAADKRAAAIAADKTGLLGVQGKQANPPNTEGIAGVQADVGTAQNNLQSAQTKMAHDQAPPPHTDVGPMPSELHGGG